MALLCFVEKRPAMKKIAFIGSGTMGTALATAACLIGKGFILIEQGDSYTKEQEDEFRYILREAGGFDSLPASQFVAGTVLTSTSPAFIAMFANSLADGGVYNGLLRYCVFSGWSGDDRCEDTGRPWVPQQRDQCGCRCL